LIRLADGALYEAKKQGERYVRYRPRHNKETSKIAIFLVLAVLAVLPPYYY